MEYVDVVNDNDEVVSSASRDECHKKSLLHRTVEVFIFKDSSLNEVLIQKRGIKSEFTPGKFCGSAGGHLIKSESYRGGALRELTEELFTSGVPKTIKLWKVAKFKINDFLGNHEIKTLYYAIYNGPFNWSMKDVSEEPKFVKIKDLIGDIENNPQKYTEAFKISLDKFLDKIKNQKES